MRTIIISWNNVTNFLIIPCSCYLGKKAKPSLLQPPVLTFDSRIGGILLISLLSSSFLPYFFIYASSWALSQPFEHWSQFSPFSSLNFPLNASPISSPHRTLLSYLSFAPPYLFQPIIMNYLRASGIILKLDKTLKVHYRTGLSKILDEVWNDSHWNNSVFTHPLCPSLSYYYVLWPPLQVWPWMLWFLVHWLCATLSNLVFDSGALFSSEQRLYIFISYMQIN